MDKEFGQADPRIARWVAEVYQPEDEVLAEVARRAHAAGLPQIAVGPLDGRHLTVIAAACRARKAVEIGALAGYSAICLLRGMGRDGFLHTFEVEEKHAEVTRESLARAGFGGRSRVHVGPALATLPGIEGEAPFDLVFIDADKERYPEYLAWAERHLRPGGVVLADNAFWHGRVADRHDDAPAAAAMRRFNEALARPDRWIATVLPTGEGLAMGVKVAPAE